MFGMALTRQSLTSQLTSGMGVFAHVCRQRRTLQATIVTIFSDDVSVYVEYETIFILFVNYYKLELLTFARSYINILRVWWEVLYEFYLVLFSAVKQFENPL